MRIPFRPHGPVPFQKGVLIAVQALTGEALVPLRRYI